MRIALTRDVSPAMDRCELSHLARSPIDQARAVAQHAAYEQCLMELGCRVHRIPSDASMPDAVFIEDTAVVVDELAVVTRPGARSRRAETESVSTALAPFRSLAVIGAPGTLDGGDVLRVGRTFYVGDSARSNRDGIAQLGELLAPWDYRVVPVTTLEFELLHFLARQPGRVFSRDALIRHVWGGGRVVDGRAVDNLISRLRQKLEPDPARPVHLQTVWGAGYRFGETGA